MAEEAKELEVIAAIVVMQDWFCFVFVSGEDVSFLGVMAGVES